jgi:L-alanine-DL-glutamate epimerase-like enolase superfamily enzyme
MEEFNSPILVAADESVQDMQDLDAAARRWDVINVKLDKCGGLSEALAMIRRIQGLGLRAMVGSMGGTSLAMAPAFLAAQLAEFVDLDAPAFLRMDRQPAVQFRDGRIWTPSSHWGSG